MTRAVKNLPAANCDEFSPRAAFPWTLLAIQCVLWGTLLALIFAALPRFLAVMADFGADLPDGTIIALKISALFRVPAFLALVVLLISATDIAIALNPSRVPGDRAWLPIWFVIVPLALVTSLIVAIAIPVGRLLWRIYF